MIPPRAHPKAGIANCRALEDRSSKLVNPVIHTGQGRLTVHGEIATGCHLVYQSGDRAAVCDRNWQRQRELDVALDNYSMPQGYAPVWGEVGDGAPRPWLELQVGVMGPPINVPNK